MFLISPPSVTLMVNNLVDKNCHDGSEPPVLFTDEEESLLLFEDDLKNIEDGTEALNGAGLPPFSSVRRPLCAPGETLTSEMPPVAHFLISDELLLDDDSEPEDQIISDTKSWKCHEGVEDGQEELKTEGQTFDCSADLFSVTFDLGFCSSGSEDEIPALASDRSSWGQPTCPEGVLIRRSRTPAVLQVRWNQECASFHSAPSPPVKERVMSTPLSNRWTGVKMALNPRADSLGFSVEETKSGDQLFAHQSPRRTAVEHLTSESEDDVFLRKTKKPKGNVLKSPEDLKNNDLDSPIHVVKRPRVLRRISSELSSSDDESKNFDRRSPRLEHFKDRNVNTRKGSEAQKKRIQVKTIARRFLDDEAEVSGEDAGCVSSDEDDESGNEQDSSLLDFVNDQTQLSQAINDSEMRAIYMKSVRSPLMSTKYKMVRGKHTNMNVFSQLRPRALHTLGSCCLSPDPHTCTGPERGILPLEYSKCEYSTQQQAWIPEQDENYLEDSFCVDEEESCKSQSSEEEICVDFNLTKDSFTDEDIRYKTRYAVKLKQMNKKQNYTRSRKKLSRIILPDNDSSEEENTTKDREHSGAGRAAGELTQQGQPWAAGPCGSSEQPTVLSNPAGNLSSRQRQQVPASATGAPPGALSVKGQSRNKIQSAFPPCTDVESRKECGNQLLQECGNQLLQWKVDDGEHSDSSAAPCPASLLPVAEVHTAPRHPQEGTRACILADSREITTGLEVISSLRTVHGLQVEICPLNGCDYIVSNRMVVERKSQSEMLSNTAKKKFIEQIQHLQSMFQRICVIVEKDREKAGDISKMFRRTKCYDSLLTALVGAGIRILFSSGQEETAELLKELSLVEQRKNVGIHIPTVLSTSHCEALPFYLSIPSVSYITALNMCHQFSSVKKMANRVLIKIKEQFLAVGSLLPCES
ncbi:Fanconi anemia group M protein homolog [Apodemus speciosus]|uniref:Fanconi anemia group M protein homolog n=1 Tax=Apodemus speciosus TaxID=105296 RepID=A0ABQ0FDY5_APOSI